MKNIHRDHEAHEAHQVTQVDLFLAVRTQDEPGSAHQTGNEDDREKWPERIVLAEGNEQQEECHHTSGSSGMHTHFQKQDVDQKCQHDGDAAGQQ